MLIVSELPFQVPESLRQAGFAAVEGGGGGDGGELSLGRVSS